MNYSLKIKASVKKSLLKPTNEDRTKLITTIDSLASNPHRGSQLKGDLTGLRRIHVGIYRIIYEVLDQELIVLVIKVGHCRNVYKKRK